jgi:aminoglycoside phosphotransferase (APT) family kinase protein
LSGSLPEPLLAFVRRAGLAAAGESPPGTPLTGGVSSDIWRVELASGPIVVKRALARLRVAQLWEAPVERNRYERLWLEQANAIVPGVAPRVLAGDEGGMFAMEYFDGLPVWKAELREGRADAEFAAEVGRRLARIHAATAGRPEIAARFATDANFHAIRLEPYLLAAARQNRRLKMTLERLAKHTARTRVALVHGDVSPKNILVGPDGPIFLDAECAWYGDPAFDIAFCLNHLLLKSAWKPEYAGDYLRCFDALAGNYMGSADWEDPWALDKRASKLLLGLLLARVDGKSPVEYLTEEAAKARIRNFVHQHINAPGGPGTLLGIRTAWQESLTS